VLLFLGHSSSIGGGSDLIVFILVAMAIIVGAPCAVAALVWDREPWWRKTPKPKKLYRDAREQVKIRRLMQKHPDAFPTEPLPPILHNPDPGKESQ
jgi:hypothetical protein